MSHWNLDDVSQLAPFLGLPAMTALVFITYPFQDCTSATVSSKRSVAGHGRHTILSMLTFAVSFNAVI